jgi:hypothetical protein
MFSLSKAMFAILEGALAAHPKNEQRAVNAATREWMQQRETSAYLQDAGKERVQSMLQKMRRVGA